MIKIIGMVMVVLAGIGAGLYASAELNRRSTSLEKLERLIGFMSTQIRYTAAPIKDIVAQAAFNNEFSDLLYIQETNTRMTGGERPDEAWANAIRVCSEGSGLNAQDAELLLNFGQGLGKSDVEGQLSHCEAFYHRIEDRLQAARSDVQTKGKLYITLGVVGGLGVALLLL